MRCLIRVYLAGLILTLTVGPVVAAPMSLTAEPHVSAPVEASHSTAGALLQTLLYSIAALGAIRIRDTASLAKKFVQRAGNAAGDYKDGIALGGADWEANAKNAEPNYEAGVQAAIGRKAFGAGVSGSQGKYLANAQGVGAQRYPQGVQNAQDAWARGVNPYLDKLKGLALPAPGPRGSPANQQRSNAVALELRKMKEGK